MPPPFVPLVKAHHQGELAIGRWTGGPYLDKWLEWGTQRTSMLQTWARDRSLRYELKRIWDEEQPTEAGLKQILWDMIIGKVPEFLRGV